MPLQKLYQLGGVSTLRAFRNKALRGKPGDIEKLETLGKLTSAGALCGLGKGAPNPVLSTIEHFREEYEAHIRDKSCPACVCKPLFQFKIDKEQCNGCGACKKNCTYDAIEGEPKAPHKIIAAKCTKCGACYDACRFAAVMKVPNSSVGTLAKV